MKGRKQRTMKKLTTYTKIPEHLILDHILVRLPIKTLIRFKSVSKYWYSSISSSQFANFCLRFHNNYNNNKFLVIVDEYDKPYFISLSYDEFNNLRYPVKLDKTPNDHHYSLFVGSANGLVCICTPGGDHIEYTGFYICNPATRQYHRINYPERKLIPFSNGLWFGYIPSIDDYMIVAAFSPCYKNKTSFYHQVYVFSLNTRKWKRMKDLDKLFGLSTSRYMLSIGTKVINGILFWSLQNISRNISIPVFGFDLVNKKLREFPSLELLKVSVDNGDWYSCLRFLEIKGCLAINARTLPRCSEIWILKQYDNWSSWEKLSSYDDTMFPRTVLCHVTRTGKYIVSERVKEKYKGKYPNMRTLKIIDPSKKDSKILQSRGVSFIDCDLSSCPIDYVESLVSPFRNVKFIQIKLSN